MNAEEIKVIILTILKTIAPDATPEALQPDTNIQETLDLDSYDFLNLMIGISEKCGVEIPEGAYGELGSLEKISRYVLERM